MQPGGVVMGRIKLQPRVIAAALGAKVVAVRAIGLWRRSGWEAAGRRHLEH
jgi:hypothetical protein